MLNQWKCALNKAVAGVVLAVVMFVSYGDAWAKGKDYNVPPADTETLYFPFDCSKISNSHECSLAREKALLKKYPEVALRKDDRLILHLENGEKIYYHNNYIPRKIEGDELFHVLHGYALIGYRKDLGLFLIFHQFYEWYYFELVSSLDGRRLSDLHTHRWEGPFLSPDTKHVAAIDCEYGTNLSIMNIGRLEFVKKTTVIKKSEICEGNTSIQPYWKDASTIDFWGVGIANPNKTILNTKVKLGEGKFELTKY
jgi:hypothetical protein